MARSRLSKPGKNWRPGLISSFSDDGAYCAYKFGVTGFTGLTNEEGRSYGVEATLTEPGLADTKMRRDFHKDDLSKLAQPEDVADLVVLVITQSPKVFTPVLSLTENPEIGMDEHWELV